MATLAELAAQGVQNVHVLDEIDGVVQQQGGQSGMGQFLSPQLPLPPPGGGQDLVFAVEMRHIFAGGRQQGQQTHKQGALRQVWRRSGVR